LDSGDTETTLMYRSAKFKNVGQLGARATDINKTILADMLNIAPKKNRDLMKEFKSEIGF
jgi:hypothetical protein